MDEEEAPSKSLVTLDTSSMPTLANSFMTYISANAPRPQVQVTNGRYLCARLAERPETLHKQGLVTRWTPANLRRALRRNEALDSLLEAWLTGCCSRREASHNIA